MASTQKKHHPVESPEWYTKGGIDTWDFIAIKGMTFFEGNIVKYLARWRTKQNPVSLKALEDLKKADAYLKKLIDMVEKSLQAE